MIALIAIGTMPVFGRISFGVRYQGIRLGGLTPKKAEEKLASREDDFSRREVVLQHGEDEARVSAEQLGISLPPEEAAKSAMESSREASFFSRIGYAFKGKRIDTPLLLDEESYSSTLAALSGRLYKGTESATIRLKDGEVVVEGGDYGEAVDKEALYQALSEGIDAPIEVKTTPVEPKTMREELRGIDALLATWETPYDASDRERAINVERGAEFFNRVLLKPGERLSFLESIGGITKDNGFVEGETISAGIETRGIGGGVCQVSTTMYNAAVRAGMNILTKHNHSKPVDYAPEGTDCAVSDGYKDFIFTNPYDVPIYIETVADGKHLRCSIYGSGEEKPYSIDLRTEKIATLPAKEEREYDGALKPEETEVVLEKVDGSVYKTYKVYKKDGRILKEELCATSRYVPVDGKIKVGDLK